MAKPKYTAKQLKEMYDPASSEWQEYNSKKSGTKEEIWEKCASLTLPFVFPENDNEQEVLPIPYNSVGAAAVNNLASKLTLALLPPTGNFFRLLPRPNKVAGLTTEEYQLLDKEISAVEQDLNMLIASQQLTTNLFDAIRTLIVTGNVLLHKIPGKSFKVFNPRYYCVDRDYAGNVIEIIIKERISAKLLPTAFIEKNIKGKKDKEDVSEFDIYTRITLVDKHKKTGVGNWVVYQEVEDEIIESTIMDYTTDTLPFITLRWTNIHNEDYGRGLVEQYLGDLISLEQLTQDVVNGTSVASKVVFGVRPGKTTRVEDLHNAENGDVILGDLESDVTTLQSNKSTDFNIAFMVMQHLEQRIGKAFLMFTSSVRDSERTTSAEIRATVNELDAALGGTYAVLAQDLQIPTIKLLLGELAPEANELTEPVIISGTNAISRERDIQNMEYLLSKLAVFGPEALMQEIKLDGFITELGTALGLDTSKFLKTAEEKKAEAEKLAQQQQALAMQEQMQ